MNKKIKKALILGGSSDLGVELTKLFIKNKWQVTVHYSGNNLNFRKRLKKENIKLIKFNFLKTNSSIDKNLKIFSKNNFDSVINLVGYINNKSFKNMKINDLLDSLKVNAVIPIFIQRNLLQSMIKKRWGRILNCGSIGVKYGGGENTFCYSFAKYALEFIPSIYKKLAKKNILINNVRVGVANTKIQKKIKGKNLKRRIKLIPIGRSATIHEIVKFIFNLSSENNTYITGETLTIAGGE
tara:strand:- start:272 stop:991 length:720 start_codon:yes stop_codon:yes gene_type:complete